MLKINFRWTLALLMVFALVIAACAPTPAPSPTPRPPTDEPEEEVVAETEAADAESAETEAAEDEGTATEAADAEQTEAAGDDEEAATEAADAEQTEAAGDDEEVTEAADMEGTELAVGEAETEEGEVVAVAPTMAATEEMAEEVMTDEAEMGGTEEADMEATDPAAVGESIEDATEEAEVQPTEAEEMETEAAEVEATDAAPMETETPGGEGAGTGEVSIASGDNVVVGLAAGLSGEGIAPLGIDIQRGAEIALSERQTVTVDGEEFTVILDVQDDQCSAEGGQAVANRFVSAEGVVAVVGPMCSSACRAAAPIFDAAGFTSVSPSCTAADLTTSGYTSFNRSVVSDAFQGRIAADFIYNQLGITQIATIHDGSPYGEGLVTVLTERFTELGGEVVAAEAVNVGDTDFRPLLEDIASEEPELIYFGGFPAEAARLAQQREDAGLEDVTFMGADGIRGTEVIDLAGEAAEGMWASSAIPATSEAMEAFLATYVETYGEEPPAPYHGTAYDAVNIVLDAVEATGSVDASGNLVVSREAISEYVRSLEDFQGLTGVLNAEGNGETSVADIGIYQVVNGEFVLTFVGRVVEGEIVLEDAPEEAAAPEDAEAEATEAAGDDAEAVETEAAEAEATEES